MKKTRHIKYKKIIISFIVTFICCFSILSIDGINEYYPIKSDNINIKIYSVWHIETFEGGGKSRITYLNKIARTIEKSHNNALFIIKQIKPENLSEMLKTNLPDIISFGYGIGNDILQFLTQLDTQNSISKNLLDSASFGSKLYAYPYIASCYAWIYHSIDYKNFVCGENGYIHPREIYTKSNLTTSNALTQYEAYKTFVNNKSTLLLGTARDVYRVLNLNNIGRLNAIIKPAENYTDLIQYVGKTKTDENIDEFILSCISPANQFELKNYSLFSCLKSKMYFDGIYSDMEDCIKSCNVGELFYENHL